MGGKYQSRFFDESTPHSEDKLRIYQTYLTPWTTKLGRAAPGGTIWIVDGFAGPGRYRSGQSGSPTIALEVAAEVAADPVCNFEVKCIFADRKKSHTDALYRLRGSPIIIEDDFWARVDDVRQLVGSDPMLLFVDPFGLLGIDFAKLRFLVEGRRRTDLIVNFRSPAAPRLRAEYHDRLSRAIGSEDWTPATVTDVFRRNLVQQCGFRWAIPLVMRRLSKGAVASELVLASRHSDAFELWNDEVVKASERLMRRDNPEDDPVSHRDDSIHEVRERLCNHVCGATSWRRRELIAWHSTEFCGDCHTGTVRRAVGQLLKEGVWKRLNRHRAVDDDLMVWA